VKSLGPKAPTTVHAPLGIIYHPNKKANVDAVLENQFISHDLQYKNNEQWMDTRVQALLTSVDDTPLEKVGCVIRKLVKALKLRKACGLDGIPKESLRHLPRRPLVHLTHLFSHCLWLSHFPTPWKVVKVTVLPKPSKETKFLQNLQMIDQMEQMIESLLAVIRTNQANKEGNNKKSEVLQSTRLPGGCLPSQN
jgi:hypothetical protein